MSYFFLTLCLQLYLDTLEHKIQQLLWVNSFRRGFSGFLGVLQTLYFDGLCVCFYNIFADFKSRENPRDGLFCSKQNKFISRDKNPHLGLMNTIMIPLSPQVKQLLRLKSKFQKNYLKYLLCFRERACSRFMESSQMRTSVQRNYANNRLYLNCKLNFIQCEMIVQDIGRLSVYIIFELFYSSRRVHDLVDIP